MNLPRLFFLFMVWFELGFKHIERTDLSWFVLKDYSKYSRQDDFRINWNEVFSHETSQNDNKFFSVATFKQNYERSETSQNGQLITKLETMAKYKTDDNQILFPYNLTVYGLIDYVGQGLTAEKNTRTLIWRIQLFYSLSCRQMTLFVLYKSISL